MTRVGVYIQVPFCQTKCTYCNFHTGVVSSARFAPYVDAVCSEIEGHRSFYEGARGGKAAVPQGLKPLEIARSMSELKLRPPEADRATGAARSAGADGSSEKMRVSTVFLSDAVVDTVYIGGGTPSLLEPAHLLRMMDAIRRSFATDLVEVTLEADPETVSAEKAEAWVAAGINRVSFGVQSFSDEELKTTGRMHRRADVYRVVPILQRAGIGNISFDLIAGLPGQTAVSWRRSLE